MDSFYGNWEVDLTRTAGVAEIGRLLGWTDEKQYVLSSLVYVLRIEPVGEKSRCVVDYGQIKLEFCFKLGELFDYNGADGTQAKCSVTLDGGKLVENYTSVEGVKWRTERTLSGTNMTATTTLDGHPGLKCVQELTKV